MSESEASYSAMPEVQSFTGEPETADGTGQPPDSLQVVAGSNIVLTWNVCDAPGGVELTDPAAGPQTFAAGTNTATVTPAQEDQDYSLVAISGEQRSEVARVHVSTHAPDAVVSAHAAVRPAMQSSADTWSGVLQSTLFASPEMKAWAADPDAKPIKKGSPAPLIRAVRGALRALSTATGAAQKSYGSGVGESWYGAVTDAVKAFQTDHQGDDLSSFGVTGPSVNGQVDRASAIAIDQALAKSQYPLLYPAVTISASELYPDGAQIPELARRAIEVLRTWEKDQVPYSTKDAGNTGSPYVSSVGFGGKWWFFGTGSATCSPSTVAAIFWACGGMYNGKHIAHDPAWNDAYSRWQITVSRDAQPDGCTGAVEALGMGAALRLTPDEIAAAKGDGDRLVRTQVNKLRPGDLVQGWKYAAGDTNALHAPGAGHSFFITSVASPDENGDVPGFNILTANSGSKHAPGCVSEKTRKWDDWQDVRIARFFKIDGES